MGKNPTGWLGACYRVSGSCNDVVGLGHPMVQVANTDSYMEKKKLVKVNKNNEK
jgi:hypothetical protein